MNKQNPLIFIEHMLENIQDINSFVKNLSKEEFCKNKEKINAVVRCLEIIGEAAKNLPSFFRNNRVNINWRGLVGTRDIIIHHYFGVDLDIVWNIIQKDLPELKNKLLEIKKELTNSS